MLDRRRDTRPCGRARAIRAGHWVPPKVVSNSVLDVSFWRNELMMEAIRRGSGESLFALRVVFLHCVWTFGDNPRAFSRDGIWCERTMWTVLLSHVSDRFTFRRSIQPGCTGVRPLLLSPQVAATTRRPFPAMHSYRSRDQRWCGRTCPNATAQRYCGGTSGGPSFCNLGVKPSSIVAGTSRLP